jgi:cyclohexanone monooxygenase
MSFEDDSLMGVGENSPDLEDARKRYRIERSKRLRSDGLNQYTNSIEHESFDKDPFAQEAEPRPPVTEDIDVAVIGAGIGGLQAAVMLKQACGDSLRMRLIDKASDVGGVWYWNRYPGAQCDVESYIYLPLLEETGYLPVEKYSHGPEILQHCRRIAEHFDLYATAMLGTEVKDVVWLEERRRWRITTDKSDELFARFVVMSPGAQHRPRLPGIAGIESFAGASFHTSRWDYQYTAGYSDGRLTGLADKRVGIIGTGATSLQVVPHLAEWAQHLYVFQRTPSTVAERGNRPTDQGWASSLQPGWQHQRQTNFMRVVAGKERQDMVADGWTQLLGELNWVERTRRAEEPNQATASLAVEAVDFEIMEGVRRRIRSVVKDADTAQALLPYYRLMCKRPGFHDRYLDTFNRPNVTLVDSKGAGVERVTPHGVVVAGREYDIDCLVFATGFDVGRGYIRAAGFDVAGRDGQKLTDAWANGMRTFHGFHSHGYPNCFFLGATQSAISPNFTHSLRIQAEHVAHMIQAACEQGVTRIEATEEAQDEWCSIIASFVTPETLQFQRECTPSYFNNEGAVGDPNALQAGRYGDFEEFVDILEKWRATGDFGGLDVA